MGVSSRLAHFGCDQHVCACTFVLNFSLTYMRGPFFQSNANVILIRAFSIFACKNI